VGGGQQVLFELKDRFRRLPFFFYDLLYAGIAYPPVEGIVRGPKFIPAMGRSKIDQCFDLIGPTKLRQDRDCGVERIAGAPSGGQ
jgi:hypothetical protein